MNETNKDLSGFKNSALNFIKTVPKGKVVSYGQVAAACGRPRAAREVGWLLRGLDAGNSNLPWWRVVNNSGIISIKGNPAASKEQQRQLLLKDGVEVKEDFTLDMQRFRFRPPVNT